MQVPNTNLVQFWNIPTFIFRQTDFTQICTLEAFIEQICLRFQYFQRQKSTSPLLKESLQWLELVSHEYIILWLWLKSLPWELARLYFSLRVSGLVGLGWCFSLVGNHITLIEFWTKTVAKLSSAEPSYIITVNYPASHPPSLQSITTGCHWFDSSTCFILK